MRRDWIGLWFVIQAERGHGDGVPFFLAHLSKAKFEDFSFRHRDMDGVAAMHHAFQKLNLETARAGKLVKQPPWFDRPRLLWKGLAGNSGAQKPNWRQFRPEITAKQNSFAFLVLEEEAERALSAHLVKQGVSLTAYLLSTLSKAIELELLSAPVTGSWLLPVDMRPAFPNQTLPGNCVSYVKVPAGANALDIHRGIKRALGAFEHWSNWWVYHIGRVVGMGGMRMLSRKSAERTFWLGSFTDLGDWTPSPSGESEKYRDCVWAIAAPGTPNNPVGCGTVAWFGKRSVSLRIHPSVAADSAICESILKRLAGAISVDTGGPEAMILKTQTTME